MRHGDAKSAAPAHPRNARGIRDHDDLAAARADLLDIREGLLEQRVRRRDDDDRHVVVDEGDRPVLHLAGGVALGVDVGDLLQLQGAFERQRIGGAAPEIEDVAGERDFGGDLLDRLVVVQDFAGARRHLGELAGEPGLLRGVDRAARPRHRDCEGGEDSELRRKGLGRGDADLGAGEGRQDHVGLARDRALRLVDDGDDLLPGLAAIAQRG